eukprot:5110701-Pyramimonas_sp.AAC.1
MQLLGGVKFRIGAGICSGGPCQETACSPPAYPGFRGFCHGERGVPTAKIHGRPWVSGLDFLWR